MPMSLPAISVPTARSRQLLVVVVGPSGSGKSTLIKRFLALETNFVASISATTRAPRGQEQDGVDYHFLTEDQFQQRIDDDGFLEYAQVFGKHFYGTPRSYIDHCFAAGQHVIMDIDVQGAEQVRQRMPDSVQVFVTPPSVDALQARLTGRATDDEDVIARRLAEAAKECERADEFAYLIVNAELDKAVEDLRAIVRAEHCRQA